MCIDEYTPSPENMGCDYGLSRSESVILVVGNPTQAEIEEIRLKHPDSIVAVHPHIDMMQRCFDVAQSMIDTLNGMQLKPIKKPMHTDRSKYTSKRDYRNGRKKR
jgi:hypothetical protein